MEPYVSGGGIADDEEFIEIFRGWISYISIVHVLDLRVCSASETPPLLGCKRKNNALLAIHRCFERNLSY